MKVKSTLKEIITGILPVVIMITILQFTIIPVDIELYIRFLWSTVFVIVGLFLFLLGIEYGFEQAGESIGKAVVKSGELRWILFVTILLGFGVTMLEPDVQVFSKQAEFMIESVNAFQFQAVIAVGVGLFIGLAFLRIFLKIKMRYIVLLGYILAFILIPFCPIDLSAAAYDAGGATTGALTVPFMLSLAIGISSMISKDKNMSNSFGIIGIASLGPILSILIMGVISR